MEEATNSYIVERTIEVRRLNSYVYEKCGLSIFECSFIFLDLLKSGSLYVHRG